MFTWTQGYDRTDPDICEALHSGRWGIHTSHVDFNKRGGDSTFSVGIQSQEGQWPPQITPHISVIIHVYQKSTTHKGFECHMLILTRRENLCRFSVGVKPKEAVYTPDLSVITHAYQ